MLRNYMNLDRGRGYAKINNTEQQNQSKQPVKKY
jgi:hypothetical protein